MPRLFLALFVSVLLHLSVIAYLSRQERMPITVHDGSIQAPVSLTFSTVANPASITKQQMKPASLPQPEKVPKKQSNNLLSKSEPTPAKAIEKNQPPKQAMTKQEEQRKRVRDKNISQQPASVRAALKKSEVTGVSDEPVETSQADAIKKVSPIYPMRYQRRNIEGRVLLKLLVNEQGLVIRVDIKESSGFKQMDESAVEAAKQWIFKPKQVDGRQVKSWLNLPVKFQLS
ncbi:MAG: energy transducer TonB [Endozoicomonas sp. (ex Botrylloides leachii)]|nr:energy transducer TonB [Endozoicomonas sp. (ex Botrylloides leachii)]